MKKIWITALFLTLGVCGFAQTARTQSTASTPLNATAAPKNGVTATNVAKQNIAKPAVAATPMATKSTIATTINPAKANAVKQRPAAVKTTK